MLFLQGLLWVFLLWGKHSSVKICVRFFYLCEVAFGGVVFVMCGFGCFCGCGDPCGFDV